MGAKASMTLRVAEGRDARPVATPKATRATWRCDSPGIRPEDLDVYKNITDVNNLCGRTQGPKAMTRIVAAYLDARHAGKLLELLGAMEPLAKVLNVPKTSLPAEFGATL